MFSMQVPLNTEPKIYTHDELPEDIRFIDKRSGTRIVLDSFLATFRDLSSALSSVPSRILTAFNRHPYSEYCDPKKVETWQQWKPESTKLHLCSHGYKGNPSIWDNYIKALRKTDPKSNVRVPFIPEAGNCELEKAAQPIRQMARSFINEQIDKHENTTIEINFYAVSNGVRVVLKALDGLIDEDLIARMKAKNIQLVIKLNGIAGVVRGTSYWKLRLANTNNCTRKLAKFLGNATEVITDFQYKGEASTKLIDTARKLQNISNITFKFAFFASTEDGLVKPHYSSLPVLGKGETHHIVHGEGHTSVVDRVLPFILAAPAA